MLDDDGVIFLTILESTNLKYAIYFPKKLRRNCPRDEKRRSQRTFMARFTPQTQQVTLMRRRTNLSQIRSSTAPRYSYSIPNPRKRVELALRTCSPRPSTKAEIMKVSRRTSPKTPNPCTRRPCSSSTSISTIPTARPTRSRRTSHHPPSRSPSHHARRIRHSRAHCAPSHLSTCLSSHHSTRKQGSGIGRRTRECRRRRGTGSCEYSAGG